MATPVDFGRLTSTTGVDFTLRPDPPHTQRLLEALPGDRETQVRVGCPVWSVKEWVGGLYPEGTKNKEFLAAYGRHMGTVELNASFYAVPAPARVDAWREAVPEGFQFCPKLFRGISHNQGAAAGLDAFVDVIGRFGDRLGLCYLQLPPGFHPGRRGELEALLQLVTPKLPLAVEFRNRAWFESYGLRESAADLLLKYGAATVITDVAGRRDVSHATLTAPRVIVRFQGYNLEPMDYERIDAWVERLATWIEAGLESVYFMVHQPNEVHSPELASYLVQRLNDACDLGLHDWKAAQDEEAPEPESGPGQMSLF